MTHPSRFQDVEYDGPRRMECIECNSEGWEPEFAPDGCLECGEDMCLECKRKCRLCTHCYVNNKL